MASSTSTSDATKQEQSTPHVEKLTTQIAALKKRVATLESQLEKGKAGTIRAADAVRKTHALAEQFAARTDNAEREVVRLKEEAETLNREVRRLKKEPKENASNFANLTREWLALKHPSTDGYPEGEDMDNFVVMKLIKDVLRTHGLIEWDTIGINLADEIDKLAENKEKVVKKLANAEQALSAAKDEAEQLETHNELLLYWSQLTIEEKQRVVKWFISAEEKAAAARKIEVMKAEHRRWEKRLSARILDAEKRTSAAEKRTSAAEQELAVLRGRHINEKKSDTGGLLAATATAGQIPHQQAVKDSEDRQAETAFLQMQGVQGNKRKATEQGNAEAIKRLRDSAF